MDEAQKAWDALSDTERQFLCDLFTGKKWKVDLRKARSRKYAGLITVTASPWISQRPDVQFTVRGFEVVKDYLRQQVANN
jgi:hypothetical protein